MSMSMNKIFYKVKKHLLTQGERSYSENDGGVCLYRSPNGMSCAVGCLMTDDMYSVHLERNNVTNSTIVKVLTPIIGVHHYKRTMKLELLTMLQRLHDVVPVSNWSIKLDEIQKKYGIGDRV